MSSETPTDYFPERVIRQVRTDATRAVVRARYCVRQSEILDLRCVEESAEQEDSFGSQLWYFEGIGVDPQEVRHLVYGVIEYSIQFGHQELVDDGVFDSEHQRERFHNLYRHEQTQPSWRQPAHRWLIAAVLAVAAVFLAAWLMKSLLL